MIEFTQDWGGDTSIYIMTEDGVCFCMVKRYGGHYNYNMLYELYVKEEYRRQGYATKMLDYIDSRFSDRKHTCVSVEKDAPQWLIDMYENRNYVIWEK